MRVADASYAFGCEDVTSMYTHQRHKTRIDGSVSDFPILQDLSHCNGTCPTSTLGASELGPREPLGTNEVEQGEISIGVINVDFCRVEREDEGLGFE
jgi:hypothetical protein